MNGSSSLASARNSFSEIVEASNSRQLIRFAIRKNHDIIWTNIAPGAQIPAPMNETRAAENPVGVPISVVAKSDVMNCSRHPEIVSVSSQPRNSSPQFPVAAVRRSAGDRQRRCLPTLTLITRHEVIPT